MERNHKISKTDFSYKPAAAFVDQVTKSKINKHLLDINDTISEEDIRNIKVGVPDIPAIQINTDENIHRRKPITPWNILDIEA